MDKKYYPKVSIITPVKNSENILKKTILSILDQTYPNIEYILVHGKSQDNTSQVIKEFESKKIIVIEEEDNSIADAMNKGIKKCNGDLVVILNAGDIYIPNAVEVMVNYYKNNPNSILHADLNIFSKDYSYYCYGKEKPDFAKGMEINHITMFVPIKYFELFGYYDDSFIVCGDLDFCARMQKKGVDFLRVNKIIGEYEIGGISTTKPKIVINERHRIRKRYKLYKFIDLKYFKDLLLYLFFGNNLVKISHFRRYITYKIERVFKWKY